jgi:hypothetical protein
MRVFGRGGTQIAVQYNRIAAWLEAHRELWDGKKALPTIELARLLRRKGFYSGKTSLCDIKVSRLLEMVARKES